MALASKKLRRKLGFWEVFCIASGSMISSGLFVLPGLAYGMAGPAAVVAYALAAVLVIPAAMAQAELATAMPRSGGSYFFIERAMGALPGMLAGLANWLSISLKSAFALIGIGAFASLIWPGTTELTIKLVAIGCCAFFAALNMLSVKAAGRAQVAMVAVLLAALAGFIVLGVPHVRHAHYGNFLVRGAPAIFTTAALVFVSFGGLTKVASVAGEVHRPGHNIPRAIFLALGVVSVLYVAAVFVVVGVLPTGELYDPAGGRINLTPISSAARTFGGAPGVVIMSLAAMLAFVTTANSGILSASRNPMAMARDGLLPKVFYRVSRRFHTPHVAILATTAFLMVVIAGLSIENLVKAASTMMLMLFALVNVAVLIMRTSRIQNYRPLYRAPLYPYLQFAGVAVYLFLILEMGAVPLLITGAFMAAAAGWYVLYVRRRTGRESALVHMVRSAVASEIRRSQLEEELREIALERDEVIHDRFDHIVKDCEILDIPQAITAEQMFGRAAEVLARRLGLDVEALRRKLLDREAASSTVLQPGLAIPHVIVEGTHLFDLLPVRCREGVIFSGEKTPVHTAFILIGSADERNYHLRALMTIAQIVQESGFEQRWMAAGGLEDLRDVLLLSGRPREKEA